MDSNSKQAVKPQREVYVVEINLEIVGKVYSEKEAWDLIGKAPFGSSHVVRDGDGNVREEFIPY